MISRIWRANEVRVSSPGFGGKHILKRLSCEFLKLQLPLLELGHIATCRVLLSAAPWSRADLQAVNSYLMLYCCLALANAPFRKLGKMRLRLLKDRQSCLRSLLYCQSLSLVAGIRAEGRDQPQLSTK